MNVHNGTSTTPAVDINDYPEIKAHLDQFYPALEKRQDKGITPYNLRSCIYTDDFSKQKIVWGEISDKSKFALDNCGLFPEATTFFMIGEKLPYLLAILNSKLGEWLFNQIGTTTGMGTNRWKKYKLETLLVKTPTAQEEYEITQIIQQITENESRIIDLADGINKLIYNMYNLTEEEISFIESL